MLLMQARPVIPDRTDEFAGDVSAFACDEIGNQRYRPFCRIAVFCQKIFRNIDFFQSCELAGCDNRICHAGPESAWGDGIYSNALLGALGRESLAEPDKRSLCGSVGGKH